MVVIALAGMTVYHVLYDQTDKVKTVLTNQGLLPKNLSSQLPRSASRNYTRQLADSRMQEYRKSQEVSLQKAL